MLMGPAGHDHTPSSGCGLNYINVPFVDQVHQMSTILQFLIIRQHQRSPSSQRKKQFQGGDVERKCRQRKQALILFELNSGLNG